MQRKPAESPLRPKQKSQPKTQVSPRRVTSKSHTVHNEDKLKVYIKFKPNVKHYDELDQIKYLNDKQIEIKTSLKNKIYNFDHVFDGNQTNLEVFNLGCKELIDHVFSETHQKNHANHGLIFVYGNTGTGKTYTMGLLNVIESLTEGIVPHSIRYLFQAKKKKVYENYRISVSFCEIYMDQILDLLSFQTQNKLIIHEDSKTKQPYVENQTIIEVNTVEQAYQIINIGLQKRRVAEQRMNRKSSRGHGIITINLSPSNGDKPGRLCFIDLAGCQRLKDSQSKGITLNEALHINSSLSSLETLLMNISDQNVRNYRSSKLTRLLQPYIQYGKINLFVTSTSDSLNAIEFAKRCKGIKFMQKQLRPSPSPLKKQLKTDKTCKNTKQVQELLQFRKDSIEREKKLTSCIVSLVGMLNKITNQLQNNFKKQTLQHKYSFSQIISDADMQNTINNQIRQLEKKEEILIETNIEKLTNLGKLQINSEQILKIIQNPAQFTLKISDHLTQIVSSLKSLGTYAEYKDIYKQQFFTSQLKLRLLQNKYKTYEDGLLYLVKYINTSDKRAVKKLKDMGIFIGKQNIQNIPHLRNRKSLGKSNHKTRSIIKEPQIQQQATPGPFNPSERSAIYIDQM